MPRSARPIARRALVPLALSGALVAAPAPAVAGAAKPSRGAAPLVETQAGIAKAKGGKRATCHAARVRGRKFR